MFRWLRDSGSLLLIPNEVFVTQKIENLSYKDNLVRLNIAIGISYGSDLNKAIDPGHKRCHEYRPYFKGS